MNRHFQSINTDLQRVQGEAARVALALIGAEEQVKRAESARDNLRGQLQQLQSHLASLQGAMSLLEIIAQEESAGNAE